MQKPFYKHYVIEFFGSDFEILNDFKTLDFAVKAILPELDILVLDSSIHKFTPQGLTMLYILSASHLAIHTWPENNYAHFDLMTCSVFDINAFADQMKYVLVPSQMKIKEI